MEIEFDPRKAASNHRKHGIRFTEAATCFCDPLALCMEDPASESEHRWALIGLSKKQRYLTVVYTVRSGSIRIISARNATKREIEDYAKGI